MSGALSVLARPPFRLVEVVRPDGWVHLAPFAWNSASETLSTCCELEGMSARIAIRQSGPGGVDVIWEGGAKPSAVRAAVERMLALGEDFTEFQRLCRDRPGLRHVAERGLGRRLHSPSLWEDAVKVLCTTNVNWSGTRSMVARLVDTYGARAPDGRRCFPGPERIAPVGAEGLARATGMGYRAGRLADFARAIVGGELLLDEWEDGGLATEDLTARIGGVRGFGPYCVATLLALLGRYERLPVDSEFVAHVTKGHFNGERPTKREAESVYEDWGRWKHLAYWFEELE